MVIPAGKTVMLDVDTPVLKMLLIQGKELRVCIMPEVEKPVSGYAPFHSS